MDLFTYLLGKKGQNTQRDLFSYLLGKGAGGSGTYANFTGTSLNISNTLRARIKNITLKGATSQDGTPSPDTPIPIKVVTGEQNVNVKGKNILNYRNITERAKTYGISINDKEEVYDSSPTSDGRSWSYTNSTWQMNLEAGTYTITLIFSAQCSNDNAGLMIYTSVGSSIAGVSGNIKKLATKNLTFTLTERTDIGIVLKIYDGVAKIQLEKGSTATDYVPYQEQTYPISLGSIELAKIDNYQDYIYGTPNNWYSTNYFTKIESYNGETITTEYLSTTGGLDIGATVYYYNGGNNQLQITDTTLIEQLNNLYNATSQDGTTYITCSSASDSNEIIVFSGDIKVASVGNPLNTSLLSSNIQEEPNLDDVNEIEDIEQNDEPIEEKVS